MAEIGSHPTAVKTEDSLTVRSRQLAEAVASHIESEKNLAVRSRQLAEAVAQRVEGQEDLAIRSQQLAVAIASRIASEDGLAIRGQQLAEAVASRNESEDGLAAKVLQLADAVASRVASEEDLVVRSQQLAESNAGLEQYAESNADLEQFAYIASHDLREPLRMITSFLGLLEKRNPQLDAESREFLGFAKDGAVRMDSLVKALLEFSRIGNSSGGHSPTNTATAIAEAVSNLGILIKEVGCDLTVSDSMPDVVGDHGELVRLFQNLIGNAIKYRKAGHQPKIIVTCIERSNEWMFSVADDGIGISSEHFERIFMIFQRLHLRTEYEGAGIGLAICRRIVQRHGGKIWVESVLGVRTAFYFTLPRQMTD